MTVLACTFAGLTELWCVFLVFYVALPVNYTISSVCSGQRFYAPPAYASLPDSGDDISGRPLTTFASS